MKVASIGTSLVKRTLVTQDACLATNNLDMAWRGSEQKLVNAYDQTDSLDEI